MRCQVCKEREATIHLTEVIEGQVHETHLCQRCGQRERATQVKLTPSEGSEFKFEVMSHSPTKKKAVRVTHIPTGMSVTCDEEMPDERLKEIALQVLRARLSARRRK